MAPPKEARPGPLRLGCGRTQGAAAPWLDRLATVFAKWAGGWAWASSSMVLGPVSSVEWTFS